MSVSYFRLQYRDTFILFTISLSILLLFVIRIPTNGDTYTFSVDGRYVGAHMYHCHVHTVKHLEMGMYGPFVVRAVDGAGNFLTTINEGGPSYDVEWNLLLSTVDPAYHTATGDSAAG